MKTVMNPDKTDNKTTMCSTYSVITTELDRVIFPWKNNVTCLGSAIVDSRPASDISNKSPRGYTE